MKNSARVKYIATRMASHFYLQDVEKVATVDTIKPYNLHQNLNP
jgi:hypothetical protein